LSRAGFSPLLHHWRQQPFSLERRFLFVADARELTFI